MFVRATQKGYHGMQQYQPGEIFQLVPVAGVKMVRDPKQPTGEKPDRLVPVPHTFAPEEQLSARWMEPVADHELDETPDEYEARKLKEVKAKARNALGAKKQKAVGYAASAEEKPTGNKQVI